MKRRETNQAIVVILIITGAVLVGLHSLATPRVVPASAPATEFSAERAMEHVSAISRKPHPPGSPEIERVRDYIVAELSAMGLSPEIQETTAAQTNRRGRVVAATVENVIARIPGASSTKAVALCGHYDSMPQTPGAGDDSSAVATLLETARALRAGAPLENDVILIFTNPEEYGPALGAKAFVEEHPWVREIGLVLNYEAIGSRGPSVMFETGTANHTLIKEFGKANRRPVAQSWLQTVYELTPINTDFNRFKDREIAGLNFAYMSNGTVYHTPMDNPKTIDPRSLQHHGSYALSTARHFGDLDLSSVSDARGRDAVYFTLLRGLLIRYSNTWALPLAIAFGLVLAGVAILGFRTGHLRAGGILLGLAASLLSLFAAAGLTTGLWSLVVRLHAEYRAMYFGRVYNAHLYLFAFTALAIAIGAALQVLFRKKARSSDLTMGALILWLILALLSSLFLPGFSYLLTWPALFCALALGWVFLKDPVERGWQRVLVPCAGVVPAVVIYSASVYIMFVFAPTAMIAIPILFVALLLGLLVPQLDLLIGKRGWRFPAGALLVAFGFLISGSLTVRFDAKHPRPTSIAYLIDGDSGKAVWFSQAAGVDSWTEQFFTEEVEHGTLGELIPLAIDARMPVITGRAPSLAIDAPVVEVLADQTSGGVRKLRLKLRSTRKAPVITMDIEPGGAVRAAAIEAWRTANESSGDAWGMIYYAAPPQGIEITLEIDPAQPLRIVVSDQSRELPDIPGRPFRPRPVEMIPRANFDYGTVVITSVALR
jgi:hypothetical protein